MWLISITTLQPWQDLTSIYHILIKQNPPATNIHLQGYVKHQNQPPIPHLSTHKQTELYCLYKDVKVMVCVCDLQSPLPV